MRMGLRHGRVVEEKLRVVIFGNSANSITLICHDFTAAVNAEFHTVRKLPLAILMDSHYTETAPGEVGAESRPRASDDTENSQRSDCMIGHKERSDRKGIAIHKRPTVVIFVLFASFVAIT